MSESENGNLSRRSALLPKRVDFFSVDQTHPEPDLVEPPDSQSDHSYGAIEILAMVMLPVVIATIGYFVKNAASSKAAVDAFSNIVLAWIFSSLAATLLLMLVGLGRKKP